MRRNAYRQVVRAQPFIEGPLDERTGIACALPVRRRCGTHPDRIAEVVIERRAPSEKRQGVHRNGRNRYEHGQHRHELHRHLSGRPAGSTYPIDHQSHCRNPVTLAYTDRSLSATAPMASEAYSFTAGGRATVTGT